MNELHKKIDRILTHLQNSIFPTMLITNANELSMHFPGSKAKLYERYKSIGLKGQSILDIALRFKCSRCGRYCTPLAHPPGFAFTFGFIKTAHTGPVF